MSELDYVAADLRLHQMDEKAFVEALAVRLEEALSRNVTVTRSSQLFKKEKNVASIKIELVDYHYSLEYHPKNGIVTTIDKIVRNIKLSSKRYTIDEWLQYLTLHVKKCANLESVGMAELEKFLMS